MEIYKSHRVRGGARLREQAACLQQRAPLRQLLLQSLRHGTARRAKHIHSIIMMLANRLAGCLHGSQGGLRLAAASFRSIPDSGVDSRMIITSPSQLCGKTRVLVHISNTLCFTIICASP